MANYDYVAEKGVIIPDTAELKTSVENEYKNALGDDLDVSSATPQGRLIEMETIARADVLATNALVANCFNPNSAFGVFLDAVSALTGTYRKKSTKTRVLATITGQPNTTIPAGSQARTSAGDLFQLVNDYTFTSSGTANRYFEAVQEGAIPCVIGTLTQIVSPVLGWETINNPSGAIIGTNEESDNDLRVRRVNELYKGEALNESIISAISKLDGVESLFYFENFTNGTKLLDDKTIAPHSIYVVVDGGDNNEIAKALYEHKSLGCDYNGDVVVDYKGAYNVSYQVKFDRPTFKPIKLSIVVKAPNNSDIEDISQKVKDAISAWANGEIESVDKLGLGVSVSAFEASSAITAQVPSIFVKDVQIALVDGTLGHDTITMKVYEKATIEQDNIEVEVEVA